MDNLLKCSICKEKYDLYERKPKLLVCHHCFCMQCVQSMIKIKTNQSVSCPTCNKITSISRQGVNALTDNEYLLPQIKPSSGESSPQQEDKTNRGSEIFNSDSEEEEQDTCVTNGGGVRIFCQTCMSVAQPSCLAQHQICNYEHGVASLRERLKVAVDQAGRNLYKEIFLLEENCKVLERVQTAWVNIGRILDQTVYSHTLALSSAKSLLDKLPDSSIGLRAAKVGDPSILAKAVMSSEETMNHSSKKLHDTENISSIWKAVSNCNVIIQTPINLPLNSDGTLFPIELNDRTNEDYICLIFSLSKLLQGRLRTTTTTNAQQQLGTQQLNSNVIQQSASSVSPKSSNILSEQSTTTNNHNGLNKNTTDFQKVITTRKIVKPIPMDFVYCYFDLVQGKSFLGRVIFEVDLKEAPKMGKNFIELCTGQYGFGYANTNLWKAPTGDHIYGGDLDEGGDCSIYNKKPFFGDRSSLQDAVGVIRMRGKGTASNGEAIVGCQFLIWIRQKSFKDYYKTLVFGRVKEGLQLLSEMTPETRSMYKSIPPLTISKCGVTE